MQSLRTPVLLVAIGTIAWLMGPIGPAAAVPCGEGDTTQLIHDGDGWPWDLDQDGTVSNGLSDAFDTFGNVTIGADEYADAGADACSAEEGGQEVVYPAQTLDGLETSIKIFASPSGEGLGRWLVSLRNPGAAPVTTTYEWNGNLGSDGETFIVTTSSGDAAASTADRWSVSNDTDGDATFVPGDPVVGHIWDGLAPGAAQTAGTVDFTNTDDDVTVEYPITVPPGATFVFLHVLVQRASNGSAIGDTAALAAGLPDVFAGMSAAELASLRNWVVPTCKGKSATLFGTQGDDTVSGTAGKDVALLGDGDDKAGMLGGKDTVCAENGNDTVKGAGGNDVLLGGPGSDLLNGGPGKKDTCKGGPGLDTTKACEKGKA
jgi:hypothetical protein